MTRGEQQQVDAGDGGDPFVRQVVWLVDRAGGKESLARATGNRVSVRTLDNWVRGTYPRAAVTGAVRDLDAWARAHAEGYPAAAGAPRLVESCGPARTPAAVPAAVPPAPERPPVPSRSRWTPLALVGGAAAIVVLTAAVTVPVTLAVATGDPAVDPVQAAQVEPAPTAVPVVGVLPSQGDGRLYEETTGSIGANTFSDPRALTDNALGIPADTTVVVRCRYYSPVLPSVVPDGFWYLVDSEEWAGRWSPSNSFMNGDVPGGETLHNTDFDVPVCR